MKAQELQIRKNSIDKGYQIETNINDPGQIRFEFSDKADERLLAIVSEISRSLPKVDEPTYSFHLSLDYVTDRKIPVIKLIPEASSMVRLPLVFLVHGYDTSKEKVLRYGVHFAAAGFYTVLMDLPDHGERMPRGFYDKYSLDRPSSEAALLRNAWLNRLNLMRESLKETTELTEYFLSEPYIDPNRFGISGISLGGTVALLSAYFDPKVKAAASYLPILGFENMPGIKRFGEYSMHELAQIRLLDPLAVYQQKPFGAVLAQFGSDDKVNSDSSVNEFSLKLKTLYLESSERSKTLLHSGIGHDVTIPMVHEAVKWFKRFV